MDAESIAEIRAIRLIPNCQWPRAPCAAPRRCIQLEPVPPVHCIYPSLHWQSSLSQLPRAVCLASADPPRLSARSLDATQLGRTSSSWSQQPSPPPPQHRESVTGPSSRQTIHHLISITVRGNLSHQRDCLLQERARTSSPSSSSAAIHRKAARFWPVCPVS